MLLQFARVGGIVIVPLMRFASSTGSHNWLVALQMSVGWGSPAQ